MMSTGKYCAECGAVLNMENKSAYMTCMHGGRHYYVCNSECMWNFYNPMPKIAVVDTTQIQAQVHIVNAARSAYSAWLAHNDDTLDPDLSNHYTARQQSTEFAHAMLRLGLALEGK